VIAGVRVLLKCLLEIVWKSPGNLFRWIRRHPVLAIHGTDHNIFDHKFDGG